MTKALRLLLKRIGLLVQLVLLSLPLLAHAVESTSGDHISIRLIAPEKFAANQETLIGILFEPDEHWHVYWKNPGDSGAAPKFNITSDQADIGPIQWPAPTRLPVAHLTNIGYEGQVAYLFSVKPKSLGKVQVTADLEWLVCQEECVPGFGKLTFERESATGPSQWKPGAEAVIQSFASRLPSPAEQAPFKISKVSFEGGDLKVDVADEMPSDLNLFPTNGEFVSPAKPLKLDRGFVFKTNAGAQSPATLGFLATTSSGVWEFSDLPLAPAQSEAQSETPIWILLLSAVAGGFLLNLMPCVFPVISIKAFSLLKADGKERVRDCLQYSAGVVTTFTLIAIVFLSLRHAGKSIGWGFQLQSPLVIYSLVLLFWMMALNFLGVFEFGSSVMNLAGKQKFPNSSFGTGVLSVFIAAPCTGPFMGTALGAAAVASAPGAFLIIFCLGVGLTSPFLVFAAFPRSLSWLPRPGAWMETLKQFFAFPLLATVIWLLWVLGQQVDTLGWVFASIALLGLSFALWLGKTNLKLKRAIALLLAVGTIVFSGQRIHQATASENIHHAGAWKPYSEAELSSLLVAKKSVFIDFTAAWCITCQVNKQAVLNTDAGQAAFAKQDIVLMRADWTRYDPAITTALSRLGRNSVPVYAYYHRGSSKPVLLPQLLSLAMIENLNPDQPTEKEK
jgi:thiol:disulfide interchange protein DsbD